MISSITLHVCQQILQQSFVRPAIQKYIQNRKKQFLQQHAILKKPVQFLQKYTNVIIKNDHHEKQQQQASGDIEQELQEQPLISYHIKNNAPKQKESPYKEKRQPSKRRKRLPSYQSMRSNQVPIIFRVKENKSSSRNIQQYTERQDRNKKNLKDPKQHFFRKFGRYSHNERNNKSMALLSQRYSHNQRGSHQVSVFLQQRNKSLFMNNKSQQEFIEFQPMQRGDRSSFKGEQKSISKFKPYNYASEPQSPSKYKDGFVKLQQNSSNSKVQDFEEQLKQNYVQNLRQRKIKLQSIMKVFDLQQKKKIGVKNQTNQKQKAINNDKNSSKILNLTTDYSGNLIQIKNKHQKFQAHKKSQNQKISYKNFRSIRQLQKCKSMSRFQQKNISYLNAVNYNVKDIDEATKNVLHQIFSSSNKANKIKKQNQTSNISHNNKQNCTSDSKYFKKPSPVNSQRQDIDMFGIQSQKQCKSIVEKENITKIKKTQRKLSKHFLTNLTQTESVTVCKSFENQFKSKYDQFQQNSLSELSKCCKREFELRKSRRKPVVNKSKFGVDSPTQRIKFNQNISSNGSSKEQNILSVLFKDFNNS